MKGQSFQSLAWIFGFCALSASVLGSTDDQGTRGGNATAGNSAGSPRYTVMDLGANETPIKMTDSGYVLLHGSVWHNGSLTPLLSSQGGAIEICDIDESGKVLGSEYVVTDGHTNSPNFAPYTGPLASPPYFWQTLTTADYDKTNLPAWEVATWAPSATTPGLQGLPSIDTLYTPGFIYEKDAQPDYEGLALSGGSVYAKATVTFSLFDALVYEWYDDPYSGSDVYKDGTELGTQIANFAAYPPGIWPTQNITNATTSFQFQAANENGDVALKEASFNPTGLGDGTTNYIDGSVVDFDVTGIGNEIPAAGNECYAVGYDSNEFTVYWNNTTRTDYYDLPFQEVFGSYDTIFINGATATITSNGTTSTKAAPQAVSGHYLSEMDPTTNMFGEAQDLNLMYDVNSGWSSFSASNLNDCGAIVGTATYTQQGQNDPIAAGSHGVLLMPMAFRVDALSSTGAIQADSDSTFEAYQTQPASSLKVAKWNDAFTDNDSAPALTSTFIDTDVDAVYVRISDGGHKGAGTLTGKLQISSVDSTGATVDSGNTVDLIEDPQNPGVFQTKALLLVSDEVDRTYTATGFPAAGANNHRLFKTPLGSTLVATYTLAPGTTAVQQMVVAPQKTINLHAYILLAGISPFIGPVISASKVQADLEIAKQRWAQCGIQVNYTVTTVSSNPTGVSASGDYLLGFADFLDGNPIAFPDECKALFAGLPGAPGEICIYYVSSFQWTGDSRFAPQAITSILKHVSSADQASGCANRILVNVANDASPFTEAHESLHVLLNAEHSDYPTEFADLTMLWGVGVSGTSPSNTVTATKRISAQQAKDALTKTSFPK